MRNRDFELIVVNSPLPDEFGHELCIDAVEKTDAGVVFLVKAAQAEQLLAPLSEQGVLLLSQALQQHLFCAGHAHGGRQQPPPAALQAGERPPAGQRFAQMRLVSRAKCCLVEHAHLTEAEAHRRIEKAGHGHPPRPHRDRAGNP